MEIIDLDLHERECQRSIKAELGTTFDSLSRRVRPVEQSNSRLSTLGRLQGDRMPEARGQRAKGPRPARARRCTRTRHAPPRNAVACGTIPNRSTRAIRSTERVSWWVVARCGV
jgi:hypothetical protein